MLLLQKRQILKNGICRSDFNSIDALLKTYGTHNLFANNSTCGIGQT
jgi:hypothetical protein